MNIAKWLAQRAKQAIGVRWDCLKFARGYCGKIKLNPIQPIKYVL
jgi:hypothetical protein